MSKEKANPAALAAKMIAASLLDIAQKAYNAGAEAVGLKGGRKARRGGRSAYYRRPADFYTHGSKTFLKNKRRGL